MEDREKIDLKKYALPPVSRKYIFRVLLYIVLFIVVGLMSYRLAFKTENDIVGIDEVDVIDNVILEQDLEHN